MTARSTSNRTGRGLDGLLLVAALLVIASAAAWLIVQPLPSNVTCSTRSPDSLTFR